MYKKIILGLVLITLQSIIGVCYCNEPISATTWYCINRYTHWEQAPTFSSVTYHLQGDTLFGDTIYKTLRREDGVYCGAIRKSANGQQVYYRPGEGEEYPPSLGKEYLLYDFDVKVGDTVLAYNGFMDTADEEYSQFSSDHSIMDTLEVTSVEIISDRKHVHVKGSPWQKEGEWIEGIGTRNLLFCKDWNMYAGAYFSLWTLCAADSEGNVLYSFDTEHIGIINDCPNWEVLAVDNIPTIHSATKHLEDGQLLIEHNGKIYNALGAEVK